MVDGEPLEGGALRQVLQLNDAGDEFMTLAGRGDARAALGLEETVSDPRRSAALETAAVEAERTAIGYGR